MTKEGSTKIVNFMTPGQGFFARVWSYRYKLYSGNKLFLWKSSSLLPNTDQTNGGYRMISKEGTTKIVNFITLRTGNLVLGRGSISDIVKVHYFFQNLFSLHSGIDQIKWEYRNDDQGRVYKNCKLNYSRGHIS